MDTLIIDEEFEHLLPPLSDEEFGNLERDVVENGLREAIIVWAGTGIIVDGHNRYHICKKHGIGFGVFEKQFGSRTEAANWIVKNQKTRRNMTKGQEADVGIRLYKIQFEEEAKARQGTRTDLAAGREHSDQLVGMSGVSNSETVLTNIASDSNHAAEQHKAQKAEDFAIHETTELPQPTQQKPPYEADVPIEVVHVPDKIQKKPEKERENETAYRIAEKTGVGVGTVKRVMAVHESGEKDLIDGIQSGGLSANKAYTMMRERERKAAAAEVEQGQAILHATSGIGVTESCDLLITEVPDDVGPDEWMYAALSGVRRDGHAYVFIDPDPYNLMAYLGASVPLNVELEQVLVWSFDYIIGNSDYSRYKPSWKAILYFKGIAAHDLRFPYLKERNAVHAVNAEGGELGKSEFELRMPMELAKRLISQSTNEGDLIFDPFAKHGTFLLAAKETGRDAIGYEEDTGFAEAAYARGVDRG